MNKLSEEKLLEIHEKIIDVFNENNILLVETAPVLLALLSTVLDVVIENSKNTNAREIAYNGLIKSLIKIKNFKEEG